MLNAPINGTDSRIIPEPTSHPLIILLCLGCTEGARQTRAPPPTPTGSPAAAPTPSPAPLGGDLQRPNELYEPLVATLRARGAEVIICPDTGSVIRFAWSRCPHAIIVVDDRLFRTDTAGDRVLQDVVNSLTAYVRTGGRLIFRPSFDEYGSLQPMFRQRFGLDWQIRGHFSIPVRRGDWLDFVREDLLECFPEEYHATGVFIDSAAPAFPMYFSTGILRETNSRLVSSAAGRVGDSGWLLYCGDDIMQREADQIIFLFCGV
ncbi:hypothetical protein BJX96DRAFT_181795 [Aspergillus floccosus]